MGLSWQHSTPALGSSHALCPTDVTRGGRTAHDAVDASRASRETLLPTLLEHRSHQSAGMLPALMPGRFMTAQAPLCWSQHPLPHLCQEQCPVPVSPCHCSPSTAADTQHPIQCSRQLGTHVLPCWSSRGDAGLSRQTDSPSAPDCLAVPAHGILSCRAAPALQDGPVLPPPVTAPLWAPSSSACLQTAVCSSGTHWECHR